MLQWQAGTAASLGERGYRYEGHRPEQMLLYQLKQEKGHCLMLQVFPIAIERWQDNYGWNAKGLFITSRRAAMRRRRFIWMMTIGQVSWGY
jgi:hypothetical protein